MVAFANKQVTLQINAQGLEDLRRYVDMNVDQMTMATEKAEAAVAAMKEQLPSHPELSSMIAQHQDTTARTHRLVGALRQIQGQLQ